MVFVDETVRTKHQHFPLTSCGECQRVSHRKENDMEVKGKVKFVDHLSGVSKKTGEPYCLLKIHDELDHQYDELWGTEEFSHKVNRLGLIEGQDVVLTFSLKKNKNGYLQPYLIDIELA